MKNTLKKLIALMLSLVMIISCVPANIVKAAEPTDTFTVKNAYAGGNVSDLVIECNGVPMNEYTVTCDGVTPTKFEMGKTYRIFADSLRDVNHQMLATAVIVEADASSTLDNMPLALTSNNQGGTNTYYKAMSGPISFDFNITITDSRITITFDPNGGKGTFTGKLIEVKDIVLGEAFEKKYMMEPLKDMLGTLTGIYNSDKDNVHPSGSNNFYGATLDLSGLDTPEKVKQLIGCGFSVTCTTCTGFICFKFIDGTGYYINHVDGVEFDTTINNFDQSDASVVYEIGIADCNNGTDVIKKLMTKGIEIGKKIYDLKNDPGVTTLDLSEYGIDYTMTNTADIAKYEQTSGNGLYKFADGLAFEVKDSKVTKILDRHEILYGAKYNDGAYDSKLIILDPRRETNAEPAGSYKLENAIYKTAVKQGVYTKAEYLLAPKKFESGSKGKNLPNAPYDSPDGSKVFIGWTTTKDDPTTLVNDEDLLGSSDLTLYALWAPLEIVEQPTDSNNKVKVNANPKWDAYDKIIFEYQIKDESGSFENIDSLSQTGTYRYKITYGTTTIYSNEFEYVKPSSKTYKANDDKNTAEKISGSGKKGSTRTITPEEGRKVTDVIVKDKDGNIVEVTMNDDGTYSFKQPASNVTVEVLYEALTPEEEMQRELMKDDIKVADSNEGESINPNAKFIKGYDDGTFKPNNEVSNLELMCMVTQLFEDTSKLDAKEEIDLNQGDNEWAGNVIALANGLGLVPGNKNDKNYNLNNNVTRADLAVVVYNLIKDYSPSAKLEENCSDAIGKPYADAVAKLVELGVLKGYDDGLFHGENTLTRAEAVVVINRALRSLGFEIKVGNIQKSFPDLTKDHWAYNEIMFAANK